MSYSSYHLMPDSSDAELAAAARASRTKTIQVQEAMMRGNPAEIRAAIETDLRTKGYQVDVIPNSWSGYNFGEIDFTSWKWKIIGVLAFLGLWSWLRNKD